MATKQKKKKTGTHSAQSSRSTRSPYENGAQLRSRTLSDRKQSPHHLKAAFSPACILLSAYGFINYFSQYFPPNTEGFLASSIISLIISSITYGFYRFIISPQAEDTHKMWAIMTVGHVAASYEQIGVLLQKLVALF